jgi:hypothetical protein
MEPLPKVRQTMQFLMLTFDQTILGHVLSNSPGFRVRILTRTIRLSLEQPGTCIDIELISEYPTVTVTNTSANSSLMPITSRFKRMLSICNFLELMKCV